MQINISGHHVEVTPTLKLYVTEKLDKLAHHFDHITQIHITLSVEEKIRQTAKALINSAGLQIFAEATTEDMYSAIDEMLSKLDRQVIKHKEKLKDRKNNGLD